MVGEHEHTSNRRSGDWKNGCSAPKPSYRLCSREATRHVYKNNIRRVIPLSVIQSFIFCCLGCMPLSLCYQPRRVPFQVSKIQVDTSLEYKSNLAKNKINVLYFSLLVDSIIT